MREIKFRNLSNPLDDTLAKQLHALTSMSFYFLGDEEASVDHGSIMERRHPFRTIAQESSVGT